MERWAPIQGYGGSYEVSDQGNVRSLKYRNRAEVRKIKQHKDRKGYLLVSLCKEGKMLTKKVHRLVATAFIPNNEDRPQVNHINGDKADNRATNLEWCTDSENLRHAYRCGLKRASAEWGTVLGKKHGAESRAKWRKKQMKSIIATNTITGATIKFESAAEAEKILGIDHSSIAKVCRGRQEAAKGYIFRYGGEFLGDPG